MYVEVLQITCVARDLAADWWVGSRVVLLCTCSLAHQPTRRHKRSQVSAISPEISHLADVVLQRTKQPYKLA